MLHRGDKNTEGGVVLIWLALIAALLLGLSAFVIDLATFESRSAELQSVADAISSAAASELSGGRRIDNDFLYPGGWIRVHRTALRTLKIYGPSGIDVSDVFMKQIHNRQQMDPFAQDYLDGLNDYRYNTASGTALEMTVERGMVAIDPEDSNRTKFISFESPDGGPVKKNHFGIQVNRLASAVRITLRLKGIRPFMAQFLGFSSAIDLERTSISSTQASHEACVVPFAINACELFRPEQVSEAVGDWDNYTQTENLQYYNPSFEGARELTFSDARYVSAGAYGKVRANNIPRPPIYKLLNTNESVNHSAIPMQGIVGIPTYNPRRVIPGMADPPPPNAFYLTPEEARESLKAILVTTPGCVYAKVGAYFQPLNQFGPVPTTDFLDNSGLKQTLANWINSSSTTFFSVFGSGAWSTTAERDAVQKNFPALRSLRSDLPPGPIVLGEPHLFSDLFLGNYPPDKTPIMYFPLGNMAPYSSAYGSAWQDSLKKDAQNVWTNPMCHDPLIPRNDPNAKVRTATVMLIAAASKTADGDQISYCPYYSENWGSDQSWETESPPHHADAFNVPSSTTDPRIVGFVDVDFFDFGLTNLDPDGDNFPPPPGDRDPMLMGIEKELILDSNGVLKEGPSRCGIVSECALDPISCKFLDRPQLLFMPQTESSICADPTQYGLPVTYGQDRFSKDLQSNPSAPPACSTVGEEYFLPEEYPDPWPFALLANYPWDKVIGKCIPWGGQIGVDATAQMPNMSAGWGCAAIRGRVRAEDRAIFLGSKGFSTPPSRLISFSPDDSQ